MSLLASFTKRNKLNESIKKTQQARKNEGATADGLFKSAYQNYAEVLQDDPLRADTLYNWGFALLHQAKTKTGAEAAALLQDAINKFAFCLLINPHYLAAAIDGGVAYMELARLQSAKADDPLYVHAKRQFETANRIQKATASYNLACIHALGNDLSACQKALEEARDHGQLPEPDTMRDDPDLANAVKQAWFDELLASLKPKPEEDAVEAPAAAENATTDNNSSKE